MKYLFRSPVYPVVFKLGPGAVCAATAKDLDGYLKRNASRLETECELIDSRWEGWVLYPQEALVSPMALQKRYTKREFLLFCGVSEEQVARTNLNKYSREQLFAFVFEQSHRKT